MKVTVLLEELLATRQEGRRVRRLAHQHRRRRPVRQRLRRDQSELEDPGAARPQHARRRRASSSRARSWSTSPRSSTPSCRRAGSARAECMSWLFWQMGSAPFLGGGFGHFYAYAPEKMRVPDQPLRHGSEAPARRARPQSRRSRRFLVRRRVHDRRHGHLPVVRRAGAAQHL